MAEKFNCEVHAFDPTSTLESKGNVHVHRFGLVTRAQSNSAVYNTYHTSTLKHIRDVMNTLGHTSLSILALDCEGCEWSVLNDIVCSSDIAIGQIVIEFHFQKHLGLSTAGDVHDANHVVECLETNGWELAYWEQSGTSRRDWVYAPDILRALQKTGAAVYATFHRPVKPTHVKLGEAIEHQHRACVNNDIEAMKKLNPNMNSKNC